MYRSDFPSLRTLHTDEPVLQCSVAFCGNQSSIKRQEPPHTPYTNTQPTQPIIPPPQKHYTNALDAHIAMNPLPHNGGNLQGMFASLTKIPVVGPVFGAVHSAANTCLMTVMKTGGQYLTYPLHDALRACEALDRELRNRYNIDSGCEFSGAALSLHWGGYASACRRAQALAKPLLVYIHCPEHPDTDTFVRDSLGNAAVLEVIRNGYVLWGASIHDAEGFAFSAKLGVAAFPFIGAFFVANEVCVGALKIEGAVEAVQLCQRLEEARETIDGSLRSRASAHAEAEARQQLRDLQREELLQAEVVDRAASLERSHREAQEALLAERALHEAEAARLQEENLQREIEHLRVSLPPEPDAGEPGVITLKITMLSGQSVQRRFLGSDTLQV